MMVRLEIENDVCSECAKPIHRHKGCEIWSHDLFADLLECRTMRPTPPNAGNTQHGPGFYEETK